MTEGGKGTSPGPSAQLRPLSRRHTKQRPDAKPSVPQFPLSKELTADVSITWFLEGFARTATTTKKQLDILANEARNGASAQAYK